MARVLVVEDDDTLRAGLCRGFESRRHAVFSASTGEQAIEIGRRERPSAAVVDLSLPALGGLGAFAALKTENTDLIGVAISGVFHPAEGARAARAAGATRFFSKPFDLFVLIDYVEQQLRPLKPEDLELSRPAGMIGDSDVMRDVYRLIAQAARMSANVLIEGETGTGKELVARAVHAASSRSRGPFVAINCAGVPRELLESELFGSEPGAFTGAVARPGRFEQSKGGTLFLDEIGDLSLSAQATLLRVLDQKVVQRLGGARDIPVDTRVVAATNVDLDRTMAAGVFRADLLYRLRQLTIRLPPLRDRGDDLRQIIAARLPTICQHAGVPSKDLSDAASLALQRHEWPGNIRELEHCLLYAVSHARAMSIGRDDLPKSLRVGAMTVSPTIPVRPAHLGLADACAALVAAAERQWIGFEVAQSKTQAEAARALRINVKTLYEKMARYSIERRRSG